MHYTLAWPASSHTSLLGLDESVKAKIQVKRTNDKREEENVIIVNAGINSSRHIYSKDRRGRERYTEEHFRENSGKTQRVIWAGM